MVAWTEARTRVAERSAARTPYQLMAGGGNTFASVLVYKKRRIDNTELIKRQASLLGFEAGDSTV
jgi:hypothetical protein